MPRSCCFTVVLSVLLMLCPQTYGQVSLDEAGIVVPSSGEVKAWPTYDVHGNGFSNFDMVAAIGRGYGAVLFGHDGASPCGSRLSTVYVYESVSREAPGYYVDGDRPGDEDLIGNAAKSQPPGSGGFGLHVAGDAADGSEVVFSLTASGMDTLSALVSPRIISATSYVGGSGEMHLWQVTRINQGLRPGQSLPPGNIANHPARIPGSGRSRTCGVLSLGEGGVVTVTEDMTGGDPGAVFGIPSPGKSVIVITVWGDYGNSVRTPSFMYPGIGGDAPARQSIGGVGYFVVRTAKNTAMAFFPDGSVITDFGYYTLGVELPPGIISLETEGAERGISAWGAARTAIAVTGVDPQGKKHPCVVVVDVVAPGTPNPIVRHILQVDEDLPNPPDFTDGSAMDVSVGPGKEILVAWRNFPSQSPVARFYDKDLNPITPTFWVSTKEAADVNTGDTTIKCSLQDEFGWVAWLSESFNPGLNCKGNQMQRDTVVRAFQNPTWVSAVKDWEGY